MNIKNQRLFNHLAKEHNINLVESELDEIIKLCNRVASVEIAELKLSMGITSNSFQNIIAANQAAWIEWVHGKGAIAGMKWIQNCLFGPGLIPDASFSKYYKEAQYFYSEQRSDPFPVCVCGKPSSILSMGFGYCCDEHYEMHREKLQENSKNITTKIINNMSGGNKND